MYGDITKPINYANNVLIWNTALLREHGTSRKWIGQQRALYTFSGPVFLNNFILLVIAFKLGLWWVQIWLSDCPFFPQNSGKYWVYYTMLPAWLYILNKHQCNLMVFKSFHKLFNQISNCEILTNIESKLTTTTWTSMFNWCDAEHHFGLFLQNASTYL